MSINPKRWLKKNSLRFSGEPSTTQRYYYEVPSPLRGAGLPDGAYSTGFFTANDGTEIYYEDTGGQGPVLLFLYGLGCGINHWKRQIHYFARPRLHEPSYRVVWMDFRGHGRSPKIDPSEVSLRVLAEDVAGLIDHLDLEDVTILGQSMGGSVALVALEGGLTRVSGVVLQGSPPKSPSEAFKSTGLPTAPWKGMIQANRLAPKLIRRLYGPLPALTRPMAEIVRLVGFNPELADFRDVEEYVRVLLSVDPNLFWNLAEDLESFDVAELGPMPDVPVLILAGLKDRAVPMKSIEYMDDHFANSQVEAIPHGSHCPHLDDPDLVNARILRFVEGYSKIESAKKRQKKT